MSSKEEVRTKDTLHIKLIGPDGKIKEERDSEKPISAWAKLLAVILFIPYVIYKVFVTSKN